MSLNQSRLMRFAEDQIPKILAEAQGRGITLSPNKAPTFQVESKAIGCFGVEEFKREYAEHVSDLLREIANSRADLSRITVYFDNMEYGLKIVAHVTT